MEGPTPVSALIHAATLVISGVFLFLRLAPVVDLYYDQSVILVIVGAYTAFYSALSACLQFDIKKIIAYSTCSQLGYMVTALGLGQYEISFFHLLGHAYFKALLFLGAGAIIHSLGDEQDIRRMGQMYRFSPLAYIAMLIGTLSSVGFPFFTGFYTKYSIIEMAYVFSQLGHESFFVSGFLFRFICACAFVLLMTTAFITVIYS